MIPKVLNPTYSSELRPIACYNTLYMCITKLIFMRLKHVINHQVNASQGAFVEGRSILYNILTCGDLVKLYNKKNASPRCIMNIELQKAYETAMWEFMKGC